MTNTSGAAGRAASRALSLIVAAGVAVNTIGPVRAQPTNAPATSAPSTAPDAAKSAQENMFWDSAQHSNALEDYKAYLEAYPNGVYAPLARNRIAALSPASPPAATDKSAQENLMWQSAEKSKAAADYNAYLEAFPNGAYAPLARNRLGALSAAPTAPSSPGAPAPVAAQEPAPPSGSPSPVSPDLLKSEVGTVETERSLHLALDQRMELQQRLRALGLYAGPLDGDLGAGAREAIAEWQKQHDLTPTGELGARQFAALRSESDDALAKAPTAMSVVVPSGPPGAPSAFGPPPAPVSEQALQAEIGTVASEDALGMGPPQRMELQGRLKAIGLYGGPIDGELGPGARAAVAEWQQRHNLAPTGELGPLQLSQLRIDTEVAFQQMIAAQPVVRVAPAPVYVHHVYAAPAAQPNPAPMAAAAIIGAIGLGLLGAKLGGGKFGGGGGDGGGGGKFGGGKLGGGKAGGKGEEHKREK